MQELMSDSFVDIKISESEYTRIRDFLYFESGISLGDHKQLMVIGRLRKRLLHYALCSYDEYLKLTLDSNKHRGERQLMLDLLTTNETYFFRETAHFDFMNDVILAAHPDSRPFRVWSAASSTGEEAYSIAMDLDWKLGLAPWQVLGTDISNSVVKKAKTALYRMSRTEGVPEHYLKRYCLKGKEQYADHLLIEPTLASRVEFKVLNLTKAVELDRFFDVIFLRNVLIYFDVLTQKKVLKNIAGSLVKGGYLMIGHSESLNSLGLSDVYRSVAPTIYQRL